MNTYTVQIRDHANQQDVTYTVTPKGGSWATEPASPGDHQSAIERAMVDFERQRVAREAAEGFSVEVVSITEAESRKAAPKKASGG